MVVKHIVMWDLRDDSAQSKSHLIALVQNKFESLLGKIPGLLHMEIGVDASHADYSCDVVLYSEFDSYESLASYANHPAHLQIRQELEGIRIARHQVDYVAASKSLSAVNEN